MHIKTLPASTPYPNPKLLTHFKYLLQQHPDFSVLVYVLVHLGCYNKNIIDWWFEQHTFISHSSGG